MTTEPRYKLDEEDTAELYFQLYLKTHTRYSFLEKCRDAFGLEFFNVREAEIAWYSIDAYADRGPHNTGGGE